MITENNKGKEEQADAERLAAKCCRFSEPLDSQPHWINFRVSEVLEPTGLLTLK
jgi:hypothetical protein